MGVPGAECGGGSLIGRGNHSGEHYCGVKARAEMELTSLLGAKVFGNSGLIYLLPPAPKMWTLIFVMCLIQNYRWFLVNCVLESGTGSGFLSTKGCFRWFLVNCVLESGTGSGFLSTKGCFRSKMQSTALSVSPSSLFLKPRSPVIQNSNLLRPIQLLHPPSLLTVNLRFIHGKVSSCSASFLVSGQRFNKLKVRASSAVPDRASADEAADSGGLVRTLQLGSLFVLWYLVNIYFNIYNKQVLKVFPFPATVTAFQCGCGSVVVLLMWALNLHKRPKIRRSQLAAIMFLGMAHTMGNFLTNVSLGRVAVSFTHTIKAMEPFFTVVLAVLFLGERPSLWVVSSLVPIVGGVALASFSEASFNWIGFCSAMASNLTNQSRNVFCKKFMVNQEESLDNINLYSVLTIISFIVLVPVAIVSEGVRFSPSYLQHAASEGLDVRALCVRSVVAGLCFHSYQQISFTILQMVSPVTHSVGNCVKRVVVIVASILFFQTPVSPVNSFGTALALVGVFFYTRAKRVEPKPKAT